MDAYDNCGTQYIAADDNEIDRQRDQYDKIIKDFTDIVPILQERGFLDVFQKFFSLIIEKSGTSGIFHFFFGANGVNFLTTDNTSCMRYLYEDTKKFWWLGKTIFHGRFERLMKGFKNEGTVLQGSPQGYYECNEYDINFAVPSKITGQRSGLPNLSDNGPGIFKETVRICAEKHKGGSCVLTFDGKKLAPGLSDEGET